MHKKIKNKNNSESKDNMLKMAGSWKNIDEELFSDLTINLHRNRKADRKTKV